MTTVNTQQVAAQAIVSAMTVSIMASAMGIMMAAVGTKAYAVSPTKLKVTQEAIRDLKLAFGIEVVDKAVKNVGTDSVTVLAQEVERLVIEDMTTKYGSLATQAALTAAPPGDVASAKIIAETLAARGVRPEGFQRVLATPAGAQVIEGVKKRVKMKARPVVDTKTHMQYRSKAAAGMAVAAEYGLDSTDTWVWYAVIKKDPTRFKEIGALSQPLPKAPSSTTTQKMLVSGASRIEKRYILWDLQMKSSLGSFPTKPEAEDYANKHLNPDWREWVEIKEEESPKV